MTWVKFKSLPEFSDHECRTCGTRAPKKCLGCHHMYCTKCELARGTCDFCQRPFDEAKAVLAGYRPKTTTRDRRLVKKRLRRKARARG